MENIKLLEYTSEAGASLWLTALPLKAQGFHLAKQPFNDALHLRYGIQHEKLPMFCVCGSSYTVDHALSCPRGGFVTIRHNEICDITGEILKEVCNDVEIEPHLQKITGEKFKFKTSVTTEEARLDVAARGFWTRGSKAFADVKVFNPFAKRYSLMSSSSAHRSNEQEKKRKYNERVLEVEHGSFTPLIFTCLGGMSVECNRFYKRLAEILSEKRDTPYNDTINWIKTKISFSLLRTTILCIRGSRSLRKTGSSPIEPVATTDIEVAVNEARLNSFQDI